MKQLVQDFKSGEIKVVDVPAPVAAPGRVLVRNAFSVVSAGTERATVALGQASLVGKARQRPDLVKQVLDTVKREGVGAAVQKVQSRLDEWKALGYSSAGTVIEVGEGVTGFAAGDRVACAGQDYASHAEVVSVPVNLCAKIPEGVDLAHAAFTTLGAIALHAVRQADARIGENVAVIGLGLIGQLTVQILQAAGCRVTGFDPAVTGMDAPQPDTADAVIIAAATDSNAPLELAAKFCRDRGRVVMVGVTGMEVPREIFYRKELELRLSRSYGPGRYDPQYEEHSTDYPVGYVRWTEQRNMAAFLQLLADGKINVAIAHRLKIEDAARAYELAGGVVIEYPKTEDREPRTETIRSSVVGPLSSVRLGVIGAGHYAQGVLLPEFKRNKDVTLHTVCTATGANAKKAQEKFSFAGCTTDWRAVIADKDVNTVLVATRHNLHAEIVAAALRAGKTVWCEKPLCLRQEELDEILKAGSDRLMVGFNRRFAPWARKLPAGPVVLRYRVSVQPLPANHWVNDPAVGGGRVLGEVCHFVDFLQFAAKARPVSVFAQGFAGDNVQVAVRFADGSVGSVDYFDVAGAGLAKEHFEMFGGGRHVVVDDCRDKGQAEAVRQFVAAVKTGGPMPIPLAEIVASTRLTLAVAESVRTNQAVLL
jgi:predicted dehydrogenase/threonine dehydrogenase-like Zn-dependent dehydrogenase